MFYISPSFPNRPEFSNTPPAPPKMQSFEQQWWPQPSRSVNAGVMAVQQIGGRMVFLGSWGDLQIWLIEWLTRCTREGMKGGVGEVEGGRYGLGGGG